MPSPTPPSWVAVADLVRTRRLELGLSKNQAAVDAGISKTTWLNLETHKKPVTEGTAASVARAMHWQPGTFIDYLAGIIDAPHPVDEPTSERSSDVIVAAHGTRTETSGEEVVDVGERLERVETLLQQVLDAMQGDPE